MWRFVVHQGVTVIAVVGFIASTVFGGDNIITVRGSDSTITLVAELAEAYHNKSNSTVIVEGGGSAKGPASNLNGELELAFVSRKLTQNEMDAGLVGFAYARDGVAVVVHANNPMNDLTVEQLRDIFAGKTATWKDGNAVVEYADSINVSARQCFDSLVSVDATLDSEASVPPGQSVADSVIANTKAIGYVSALNLDDRDGLKVLTINGVAPTPESISDESYPISRTLSLVSRGQPTGQAKAFIDFVLSEEGQQIVKDADYFPVRALKAAKPASVMRSN